MSLIHFTDSNFEEILQTGNLVLVYFKADWCGPCRTLNPIINEIADEYDGRAVVANCDVDANIEVAGKFGIRSLPTVLFFKDGKIKDTQIGYAPKSVYSGKLDEALYW